MLINRKKLHYITFYLILLLSGCSKKNQSVFRKNIYTEKRDDISLYCKRLSSEETHTQFGRNLLLFGYQPIKITITNDSDDQLLLRASAIELPLLSALEVCQETERSVLGILGGPAYLSIFFAWPALIPILSIGTWLSIRNRQVKAKICETFFGEDKIIELLPFEQISRFIFVPIKTPLNRFNLHLFKRQEKVYIPFTISLR